MAENKEGLNDYFDKLEEITGKMEEEDITLEDSFNLYADGMKLLKKCSDTIDNVEKKILQLDDEGETHEFE